MAWIIGQNNVMTLSFAWLSSTNNEGLITIQKEKLNNVMSFSGIRRYKLSIYLIISETNSTGPLVCLHVDTAPTHDNDMVLLAWQPPGFNFQCLGKYGVLNTWRKVLHSITMVPSARRLCCGAASCRWPWTYFSSRQFNSCMAKHDFRAVQPKSQNGLQSQHPRLLGVGGC